MKVNNLKNLDSEKSKHISIEEYYKKIKRIKFCITFTVAAIYFFILAKDDIEVKMDKNIFIYALIIWGATFLTAFVEYILFFRKVWYHQRLPEKELQNNFSVKIELTLFNISRILLPLLMIFSIIFSFYVMWKFFS